MEFESQTIYGHILKRTCSAKHASRHTLQRLAVRAGSEGVSDVRRMSLQVPHPHRTQDWYSGDFPDIFALSKRSSLGTAKALTCTERTALYITSQPTKLVELLVSSFSLIKD